MLTELFIKHNNYNIFMKDITATVIVDLTPSKEEIFSNLQKDARWGINKAVKEGLTVEESSEWEIFYEIYKSTVISGGTNVETLDHLKAHGGVLFVCKKDENIIAGASLEIKNEIPVLSRNASLKEFQHTQPNNLLYWNCILWSKNHGYKALDLGGYQLNPRGHSIGVNKFKERWGVIEYIYVDFPFFKALGRKLIRRFSIFWYINAFVRGRK